jgi:hypothetical protein
MIFFKYIVLLFLLAFSSVVSAQSTYVYSYVDPCTGVIKEMNVPSNGVTVNYFGQMNTFQPQDFNNGVFNQWATGVFNSFGNNNPCGSILGVGTSVDIAQTTALNTLNILSSLSALGDISQSLSAMNTNGITQSVKSDKKSSNKKSSNKTTSSTGSGSTSQGSTGSGSTGSGSTAQGSTSQGSTGSGSTPQGSTGSGSTGSGSTGSGSTGSGSTPQGSTGSGSTGSGSTAQGSTNTNESSSSTTQGSTGSGGSIGTGESSGSTSSTTNPTGSGGGNSTSPKTEPNSTEEGSTNILGGTSNSVQNASGDGGKGGPKANAPTIVLSSDFAGFNFVEDESSFGGKATGGFTSLRWDGKRTHGIMLDYTSIVGGPNLTAFYGFIGKKKIDLISISGTASFIGRGSLYATAAVGQMWNVNKVKNLKLIYMGTASFGSVFGEGFIGTAAIAGSMYDVKISKRIDIKLTALYIYAPYVSYYNDIVLNSPHIILPLIGTNIGITKKFKFNINAGGTYALNQDVMNYTIMFGTRLAL